MYGKKLVIVIAALMCVGGLLFAAGDKEPGSMTGAPEEKAKDLIALSVSTTSNPFYAVMANTVQEKAIEMGFDVLILDAQNKIEKQVADVEDALTKGIKVLLINGVDDGAKPLTQKALSMGIPVIAMQRNLGEGNQTTFVGTNNVFIGEQLIKEFSNSIGGKAVKVLILTGTPGAASSEDRTKGIDNALPQFPNIQVLASQTGYYDRAKSLPVAENLLQRYPEAEAILCLNDEMAMGALAAAKALNRKVLITGMDANPDALKAIQDGELFATIALSPYNTGVLGVEFAQKIINNEAVPAMKILEVAFVTKDTVAQYIK